MSEVTILVKIGSFSYLKEASPSPKHGSYYSDVTVCECCAVAQGDIYRQVLVGRTSLENILAYALKQPSPSREEFNAKIQRELGSIGCIDCFHGELLVKVITNPNNALALAKEQQHTIDVTSRADAVLTLLNDTTIDDTSFRTSYLQSIENVLVAMHEDVSYDPTMSLVLALRPHCQVLSQGTSGGMGAIWSTMNVGVLIPSSTVTVTVPAAMDVDSSHSHNTRGSASASSSSSVGGMTSSEVEQEVTIPACVLPSFASTVIEEKRTRRGCTCLTHNTECGICDDTRLIRDLSKAGDLILTSARARRAVSDRDTDRSEFDVDEDLDAIFNRNVQYTVAKGQSRLPRPIANDIHGIYAQTKHFTRLSAPVIVAARPVVLVTSVIRGICVPTRSVVRNGTV